MALQNPSHKLYEEMYNKKEHIKNYAKSISRYFGLGFSLYGILDNPNRLVYDLDLHLTALSEEKVLFIVDLISEKLGDFLASPDKEAEKK